MSHRLNISMPPRWTVRHDASSGVLAAARPTRCGPGPTAPQIVLRSLPVDAPDLESWRVAAVEELSARLDDIAIEDEDWYLAADRPAHYLRFAHRVDGEDLLCEQWAWWLEGHGITLTCSVGRNDYLAYCDVFEGVAETVQLLPGEEPLRSALAG